MEKYGTYDVYKNEKTDEIIRVPFTQKEEKPKKDLEKVASDKDWKKLKEDPQDI